MKTAYLLFLGLVITGAKRIPKPKPKPEMFRLDTFVFDDDDDDKPYGGVDNFDVGRIPSRCPVEWQLSKNGKKCYFVAPLFKVSSYSEQIAVCTGIGGKVIEPASQAELEDVKEIVKALIGKWSNGPWINFIVPLEDNRILSGTSLSVPRDSVLATGLNQLFAQTGSAARRCIKFHADGVTFDFEDCATDANLFCERAAFEIERF